MMRKTALLMCIAVAGITAAQMKKAPTPPPGAITATPRATQQARIDAVRRITIAEAQKLLRTGEAVIVDVRSNTQFQAGHIKGAYSIPASQIIPRLRELPPRKLIITYCA
jgi:3-mercaptopyruvate sulfurtransferase SseA